MTEDFKVKRIQKSLLVLLKKFHDICIKNNIKYSLHGGTLLGAIREKGFIPWDDDIDVSLTRDEYNKLCRVMQHLNIEDNFYFDIYSNKITELWYVSENSVPVWLDIFIYDYISESVIIQKLKILFLVFFTAFTKTKTTIEFSEQRKSERSILGRILFRLVYIVGKLFNQKFKIKLFHTFASKCFVGNKKMIQRSNDQYSGIGISQILPKEYMSNYIMTDFEDTQLMISKDYNALLINFYGDDYMTPKKTSINDINVHTKVRESIKSIIK